MPSGIIEFLRALVDILIVAFIVYRVLLLIRGTRAAPMLWGLITILALYFLSRPIGLATLTWLLQNVLSSLILIVVIIFQDEIRRGLTKMGLRPLSLGSDDVLNASQVLDEIVVVCERLAQEQLGALIVLQRDVGLEQFIEKSVLLNAPVNRKLLYSIFVKGSALHDGAVLIVDGKIRAAACVLPLSYNPDIDPALGTRHRAALGISEQSDAVIIVVSEQNASISLVHEGRMTRNLDADLLRASLSKALATPEIFRNVAKPNSSEGTHAGT